MELCKVEQEEIKAKLEIENPNYEEIHKILGFLEKSGIIAIEEIEQPITEEFKYAIFENSVLLIANTENNEKRAQYYWDITTAPKYIDYVTNIFREILPVKRTYLTHDNDLITMEDENHLYFIDVLKTERSHYIKYDKEPEANSLHNSIQLAQNLADIFEITDFRLAYRDSMLINGQQTNYDFTYKYKELALDCLKDIDLFNINLLLLLTEISLKFSFILEQVTINIPLGQTNKTQLKYLEKGFLPTDKVRTFIHPQNGFKLVINADSKLDKKFYLKTPNLAKAIDLLAFDPRVIKCQCGENKMPEFVLSAAAIKKDRYILNISE